MSSERIGSWLRFITPILIALVGIFGESVYKDIKQDLANVQNTQAQIMEKIGDIRERQAVVETKLNIQHR